MKILKVKPKIFILAVFVFFQLTWQVGLLPADTIASQAEKRRLEKTKKADLENRQTVLSEIKSLKYELRQIQKQKECLKLKINQQNSIRKTILNVNNNDFKENPKSISIPKQTESDGIIVPNNYLQNKKPAFAQTLASNESHPNKAGLLRLQFDQIKKKERECQQKLKKNVGRLQSTAIPHQPTKHQPTFKKRSLLLQPKENHGQSAKKTNVRQKTLKNNSQLTDPGAISGLVTDTNGNGIENIWTDVYDLEGNFIKDDLTDFTGAYSINGLEAAEYKINFYCSSGSTYISQWYYNQGSFDSADLIVVNAGQTTADINVQMVEGGSISGTATNPSANGLANVMVAVNDLDNNWIESTYTDSSGFYQIYGLQTGNYKLEFSCINQSYLSEWYNDKNSFDTADAVSVSAGQTVSGINAQLAEGGNISGTLTDQNGDGIEYIQVIAVDQDNNWMAYDYTDDSGTYTILGLPTGDFKIHFDSSGENYISEWYNDKDSFENADWVSVITGQTTTGINAQLANGGIISGTVTDSDGNGIGNIEVSVIDSDNNWISYTYTDSSGDYAINGLFTGNFKLEFYSYDPAYISEWYNDQNSIENADPIAVTAGQTTSGINAQLAKSGIITGTVTDIHGNGIENICVSAKDQNDNWNSSVYTDASGVYTMDCMPAGNYIIYFNKNDQNYISEWYNDKNSFDTADWVSVSSGLTTSDINAQLADGGSITGMVTDQNGDGICSIEVSVFDQDNNEIAYAFTDISGAYTIVGVPTGDYIILFESYTENYVSEWYNDHLSFEDADPVSVTAGQTTSGINARLAAGGIISGTVSDTNGSGLENIEVLATNQNNSDILYTYTDSSGHYTLMKLPAGDYKIEFFVYDQNYICEWYNDKDSYETADILAVAAGQTLSDINARLAEGGIITGVVTDQNQNAIESIEISVRNQDNNEISYAFTDASGAYTLLGLPAGDYKLQFNVYGQNYISEWYNNQDSFDTADWVSVSVGQTTAGINAQLAEGGMISGTVTDESGNSLEYIYVSVRNINNIWIKGNLTDSSGFYTILGLSSGDYKLEFYAYEQNYISEWYNDKDSFTAADSVPVTAGQTTEDINAQLAEGAMISGTVTDSMGMNLESISVYAYNLMNNSTYGVNTDSSGMFVLGNLKPGPYKIQFFAQYHNYISEWYNNKNSVEEANILVAAAGQHITDINAQLAEGGIITGKVTDTNGIALNNIRVRLYDYEQYDSSIKYVYTDDTGCYSINGLPTGNYKVNFFSNSENYLLEWFNDKNSSYTADVISVTAGQTTSEINAQLTAGGIISGTVMDQNNMPVNGYVYAYDLNNNIIRSAYTNENGEYSIINLVSGLYKVKFISVENHIPLWYNQQVSFESADPVPVITGQTTAGINARLIAGGIIAGKVSPPLGDLRIAVYQSDGVLISSTSPDTSGDYVLWGLPEGSYKLFFDTSSVNMNYHKNYRYQWYYQGNFFTDAQPVEVLIGETTSVSDTLLTENGGIISGQVSNGTTGIAYAYVKAFPGRYHMEINSSCYWTDNQGNYQITGLPPGEYTVQFYGEYYNGLQYGYQLYQNTIDLAQATKVNVAEAGVVTGIDAVLHQAGTIFGQVTDNRQGLAGIKVRLINADTHLFLPCINAEAITDQQGYYAIQAPAGNWKVLFSTETFLSSCYQSQFYPGQTTLESAEILTISGGTVLKNINAVLNPGGSRIDGQVCNQFGKTVGMATVEVYLADSQTMVSSVQTNSKGQFKICGLLPGNYKLLFHHFLLQPNEWYTDQNSFANAQLIPLAEGDVCSVKVVLGGPDQHAEAIIGVFPSVGGLWKMEANGPSLEWTQLSKQQPDMIRMGDVNGNGLDDVGCWFQSTGKFWIRYDNGQWSEIPASAKDMICFDLGDLNNDGQADIVGSWTFGTWWKNTATGVWSKLSAMSPTYLAAGDFDGDGYSDMVGLYPVLNSLWIYQYNGNQWKQISKQINLNDLRTGDLDSDGKAEILGSWDIGTWSFNPSTQAWIKHSNQQASVLCSGDIDGKGDDDIIGDWSPTAAGLWVKYLEDNIWKQLSKQLPRDITSGKTK